MKNRVQKDVVVIGGGISGLSTAFFLSKQGYDIGLLEKSNRLGGAIRSERQDGFLIEYGPNSTLDTSPILHQLFDGLGISDALEYANEKSKNRYIVRNGTLHPLPMSPVAFLKTKLFSLSAKLRLFREPFISPGNAHEESLAEFVKRRLGREFLDYAINPFVAGVYAGRPELLSVKSAFPKLYELEQNYGGLIKGAIRGRRERRKKAETSKQSAKLLSFNEGLQTVIDALQEKLSEHIWMEAEIQAIRTKNNGYEVDFIKEGELNHCAGNSLLFTLPAYRYPELPFQLDVSALESLSNIYYPPVTMVFFGYHKKPSGIPLDGFGFLVPEKEHRNILGTIWSSTIFSGRAPQGGIALTTFVGGSRQPENAMLPNDKLIACVRKDLQDLMGIREQPDKIVVQKWEKAIPQYRIGHQQILDSVEKFEADHPGLFLSGNFRGGISVSDCIKQAQVMSERIQAYQQKQKQEQVIIE